MQIKANFSSSEYFMTSLSLTFTLQRKLLLKVGFSCKNRLGNLYFSGTLNKVPNLRSKVRIRTIISPIFFANFNRTLMPPSTVVKTTVEWKWFCKRFCCFFSSVISHVSWPLIFQLAWQSTLSKQRRRGFLCVCNSAKRIMTCGFWSLIFFLQPNDSYDNFFFSAFSHLL